MAEASIDDGVPTGAGWFVLNAAEARWEHDRLGSRVRFGGEGPAHFDQVGVALYWLERGEAMSIYHREAGQEDFLVLRGRPLLLVEDAERELSPWDLVHCPPRTAHTILNPAPEPALIFAVGARVGKGSARYPDSALARRHGVGNEAAGDRAEQAYAGLAPPRIAPAPPLGPARRQNRSAPIGPVIPVLTYADVRRAVDWLVEVLGFVERVRIGPDHRAQLSFAEGSLIVADATRERAAPTAGDVTQSVMLRVDDVVAICERARAAGATVVEQPRDFEYGERQCALVDPGGHHWTLTQTLRDVEPQAWGGTTPRS